MWALRRALGTLEEMVFLRPGPGPSSSGAGAAAAGVGADADAGERELRWELRWCCLRIFRLHWERCP